MTGVVSLRAETRRDIERLIRSVEELEVLLFLGRDRTRYSSSRVAAAAVGLSDAAAAAALEALASRNLLDVRIGEQLLYRLDPTTAKANAAVGRILEAGWHNRVAVLHVIMALPSSVRDFADAFRVKKGPDRA